MAKIKYKLKLLDQAPPNFYPYETKLPVRVWLDPDAERNNGHSPYRIKFGPSHDRYCVYDFYEGVMREGDLRKCDMTNKDLKKIAEWAAIYKKSLIAYFDNKINKDEISEIIRNKKPKL